MPHKPKPNPEPDPSDPYVEVKIYVEKSVIYACGGLDKAKLTAYGALVDEAQPDEAMRRELGFLN